MNGPFTLRQAQGERRVEGFRVNGVTYWFSVRAELVEA